MRLLIVAAVVAAVLVLILVSGWADDRAKPGSTGRGQVTRTDDGR